MGLVFDMFCRATNDESSRYLSAAPLDMVEWRGMMHIQRLVLDREMSFAPFNLLTTSDAWNYR
jgi:hypothetical protein